VPPVAKDCVKNAKISGMKSRSQGHWEFRSVEDVHRFWESHSRVPDRANGRKHHHEERFCLGLYLLALASHDLLSYPLSVEQDESPDFMFHWPSGESVGLEVTRAAEESQQEAKTIAHREYRRRETVAAASGMVPEPVIIQRTRIEQERFIASGGLSNALMHAPGWLAGEREAGWCSLVQKAVEKKIEKLPKFKAAARYELIVYDDTPFVGVDRETVIPGMQQWLRDLPHQKPAFDKISIIKSLDVIFDLNGECRSFPYVEWSDLKPNDPDSLMALAERVEQAGQIAVKSAIEKHAAMGRTVYFTNGEKRMIKQTPDGRRFEVQVLDNDEEVVIKEL
jgi:hypothetical protein